MSPAISQPKERRSVSAYPVARDYRVLEVGCHEYAARSQVA